MAAIDHIGIYVNDLERSIAFYRKVFGFTPHSRLELGETRIAFLDVNNGLLEIVQRPEAPTPPKGVWSHLAVTVEDFDGLLAHLSNLNIQFREMRLSEGDRIIFLKDPDGHDLEVDEKPFNK